MTTEQRLRSALKLAAIRLEILTGRMRACHEETGKHELLDEAEMFVEEAKEALALPPSAGVEIDEFVDVWVLRYGLNKILGDIKPFGHVYMSRDFEHISKDCANAKNDFALMRINKKCLTTPKISPAS